MGDRRQQLARLAAEPALDEAKAAIDRELVGAVEAGAVKTAFTDISEKLAVVTGALTGSSSTVMAPAPVWSTTRGPAGFGGGAGAGASAAGATGGGGGGSAGWAASNRARAASIGMVAG
jgi:hypothetical protein